MSGIEIGETLIDYGLKADIDKAITEEIIEQGDDSEMEDRHISLLNTLLKPLDDKEVYVVVRNLVKYHRRDFLRILEYMGTEALIEILESREGILVKHLAEDKQRLSDRILSEFFRGRIAIEENWLNETRNLIETIKKNGGIS